MTKKKEVLTQEEQNYLPLMETLQLAYLRSSRGKGKDRHATDNPFLEQPIITEGEHFGIGPHLYQIRKKALEIQRLHEIAAMNELLDIIVYAAAAYLIMKEE
jgi:hypothetical protein